jgi:medium-chain acyl-[acyl-carrier-protein] hydrolase
MSQPMSNAPVPPGHATSWLSCLRPDPGAKVRLFCLPYAGAGGSIYRNWSARLAGVAEVCPILLPGREARFRDRPHTQMQSLVAAMAEGIASQLRRPFALFGHSMGALIAFELARRIARDRGVSPACLFVSGSRPPDAVWTESPVHSLPDREFLDCLHGRYHAIPAAVRENRELAEIVLPALRADFAILETYRYEDGTRLDCPIVAYGGIQDDTVTCEELESWGRYTAKGFKGRRLPGDHFFLRTAEAELLADLSRHLGSGS